MSLKSFDLVEVQRPLNLGVNCTLSSMILAGALQRVHFHILGHAHHHVRDMALPKAWL